MILEAFFTSSKVVYRPIVILKECSDSSVVKPIAFNTCDGSIMPLVHADPVENAKFGCSEYISLFDSMFGIKRFKFPGCLFFISPLIFI